MPTILAQIATSRQEQCCEFGAFPICATYATSRVMDVIDSDWLKQHAAGRRGIQAGLARALGIGNDAVSKMFTGKRQPQAAEIPTILRYFSDLDRDGGMRASDPPGLAENSVAPFRLSSNHAMHELVRVLAPAARHAAIYRVAEPMPAFALQGGDMLVVDLGAQPAADDLVIVTLADITSGESHSAVFRYARPWLIPGMPGHPAVEMQDGDQSVAVMGTVRAMIRSAAVT